MHKDSKPKTAFFVPDGKKRFKRMPMGILNAHGVYCVIMAEVPIKFLAKFQLKYQGTYAVRVVVLQMEDSKDIPDADIEVIVDESILHSTNEECLLDFFTTLMEVYQDPFNIGQC
jgi:hypothetical protein